ncbi:ERF family protein [Paenibacillus polymyxa]|uniref:ERF family protein n=1 Tax=Paenibacillus polymyxa TaxID=1406 RepID=UPI002ED0400D|nr:ERF family protein [Paenibacillus polymyxa]
MVQTATKSLVVKLSEVMEAVKYIKKNGYNKFNKYSYATEADVNEKVREELAARKVILIPNMKSHVVREHQTRSGNTEYIVTAEVEFTFHDGESGEKISFSVFGEGQDTGDKATYKALTGAQKYALMKSFMIPTGDDPEGDSGVDERNQTSSSEPKQTQQPGKGKIDAGAITPSIKAKYQLIHGNLNGVEVFVAQHPKDADAVLTEALKNKNEGGN